MAPRADPPVGHLIDSARRGTRIDTSARQDWAWQQYARCRGLPPDIFYPPDNERQHARRRRENRARLICVRCEVAQQCLEHALRWPETHGVWGATTPRERSSKHS
ncbi:WhiB family transcriptional regulator [Mycolicibacterium sp.]|uniref:WhiB family transcriptional regulator n=1 Tax=Mycolicibacterium sp. TaxID=2320850 RepID=UPI0037C78C31